MSKVMAAMFASLVMCVFLSFHRSNSTETVPDESGRLSSSASAPFYGALVDSNIFLSEIPFIIKKPDFGGEACVAMALQSRGFEIAQDDVFNVAKVDPVLGRGCQTTELVAAARQIGFNTGPIWHQLDQEQDLEQRWGEILSDLKKQNPTVVCRLQNASEQFVLVIGFNSGKDEVVIHNPNHRGGEGERVDRLSFLRSCCLESKPTENGRRQSTFISIRLLGEHLKVPDAKPGFTDADFAQHIRKLKGRLPHNGFHVVLQKPFVVVGDGALAEVKRTSAGTIKWAVDSIKKDYFSKDPYHIIDVWLFKDSESYQRHNLEIFKSKPSTPFGYYSPANRALVMDISTGGGTLVHEIVHPFMESNFVNCPSWFNEGLASLYEQSASRDGHIVGLTNWRLRGLQLAIADGRLPSFKELCGTSSREFYDGHPTNYAQARYLCYYLQERGLLHRYFFEFRKNVAQDPGGYKTLIDVLGRDDIGLFKKQWQQFVLNLRFGQ